jgi:tetratricopeptide (TPR) repeat protein/tRNA A-37 threonylcarbamoyl transferase component Bud32
VSLWREPTSAEHGRARALFLEACALPEAEREAFLARACAGDPELEREMLALLAHDAAASAFLDEPALGRAFVLPAARELGAGSEPRGSAPHPATIGPFTILGVLGEGGMGTVYLAEQRLPKRTVALKVLHGDVGSKKSLERFELEVEILGRLKHPGIAQIYDAGRADLGRGAQLYLAMERVQGPAITRFARERGCSTAARIELLARACDAVQHAHLRGVIHRDLKPDHILVDEDGQPKVLDFGVARLLDPLARGALEQTRAGELVGTLAYMSPEQVSGSGEEIDVRADVYGLGLVAYELFADERAQELADLPLAEAVRSILVKEPRPLGEIRRDLRGDVEIIVAKALAKDRDRRYGSPAELAADLRHHLRHEPIAARPPSAWDALVRFARRRRALVAVLATLTLILVGAAVTSTSLWLRSRAEAHRSALLFDALNDLLSSVDPMRSGPDTRVVEVLREIERDLTLRLQGEPKLEAPLRLLLGSLFQKIGDYHASESNLRRALELSLAVNGPRHETTLVARIELAGLFAQFLERYVDAQVELDEALRWASREFESDDPHLFEARSYAAFLKRMRGDLSGAIADYRVLVPDAVRALGPADSQTFKIQSSSAAALREAGELEEAERVLRDVLASELAVLGPEHRTSLLTMFSLAKTLRVCARSIAEGRDVRLDEAEAWLVRVEEGRAKLLGPTHSGTWNARIERALVVRERGRSVEARELLESYVDRLRGAGELRPGDHSEGVARLIQWYRADGLEAEAQALEALLPPPASPAGGG